MDILYYIYYCHLLANLHCDTKLLSYGSKNLEEILQNLVPKWEPQLKDVFVHQIISLKHLRNLLNLLKTYS